MIGIYCGRGLTSRAGCFRTGGEDDINIQFHKLCREIGKPLPSVSIFTVFNKNVLAFYITKIPQALVKRPKVG
jgi:hypothetical protein